MDYCACDGSCMVLGVCDGPDDLAFVMVWMVYGLFDGPDGLGSF